MLPRFVNSLTLGAAILIACAAFFPFAWFLPRQSVFELIALALVASALGTIVGFHPVAWDAVRLPVHKVTWGQILVVGLVLASLGLASSFGTHLYWRMHGKPDNIIDSAALAFSCWLIFISWMLALLASGAHRDPIPTSTYKRAGILVFCATIVVGLAVILGS